VWLNGVNSTQGNERNTFRFERDGTGNVFLAWSVRKNRSKLRRTSDLKQDRKYTYEC